MQPAIYFGTIRHRRSKPARHEFTYPLFMAFLDVDRIPELMRVSPLAGYNHFNWASFHERDHFGNPALTLRQRLVADAAEQGIRLPEGPIFLLTHLRYLGYSFNPISLFYCYNREGRLDTILAEVNSTFGETHNYWLSAANQFASPDSRMYRCPKAMHVSPFMPMQLDYRFVLPPPGEQLIAHMNTMDGERSSFDATLRLRREAWSAASLHRALLRFPWVTAKVIAAIHWEALRLYCKKVPVYVHPAHIKDTHEHTSDVIR
jgi:uncharacterized protein